MAVVTMHPQEFPTDRATTSGTCSGWAYNSLNMGSRGKRHLSCNSPEVLRDGWAAFFAAPSPGQSHRQIFANVTNPTPSPASAEPHILTGNRRYYVARASHGGNYVRHVATAPAPRPFERPEGKLCLATPQPQPPRVHGVRQFPEQKIAASGRLQEPNIIRLARPHGAGRHVESEETAFEKFLQRKGRATREALANSGRAGDLTLRYSAERRVEDEDEYRVRSVEPQAFLRFVAGLGPAPEVGPHQRRQRWLAERGREERERVAEVVKELDDWEQKITSAKEAAKEAAAAASSSKKPAAKPAAVGAQKK